MGTDRRSRVKQVVPFFNVHDMERSLRFYTEGLGFTLKNKWVDDGKLRWCWLQLGGAALMLQEFWKEGHHRNVPETPVGLGVSLCFVCDDAIALYRELRSRSIDAQRPFVGNAMWVTGIVDPDGYKLFFESETDAPEDTLYQG